MSKLQEAVQNAGLSGLSFFNQKGNIDETVAVSDLPDATLLKLLAYGKRYFNDRVNGYTGKGTKEEYAKGLMDALKAGDNIIISTGGMSAFDKEYRALFCTAYVKTGLATSLKAAVKAYNDDDYKAMQELAAALLTAKGIDFDPSELSDYVEAITGKLTTAAQAIVDAATSIDL